MFKRKIKQFICVLLVASLLLVNKGMYTGCEVHAETSTKTYEEDLDKNYERSIVTDSYREFDENVATKRVDTDVVKCDCIWEKNAYPDKTRVSCEYIGPGKGEIGGQVWQYDIIKHTVDGRSYQLYAVNVRPKNPKIEEENITLPAYIEAKVGSESNVLKCVELADRAFLQNENITEVNIPDTYQRICAYAFTGCKNLKKIHFVTTNASTTSQGDAIDAYTVDETVSGEQNLKNSDLHFLGTGAFAGCKSLEAVELPTILTERYYEAIDEKGFAILPGYLTRLNFMGEGVFRDCYGLTEVTIDGFNAYIPALTLDSRNA